MENNKLRNVENAENTMEFAAVGVTFDNRQQTLQQLYGMFLSNNQCIDIILKKQEDNPYDKNAVAILLNDNRSIGYVSKQFNEEIGQMIPTIKKSYVYKIYMNNKRIFNAMIRIEF